MRPPAGPTLRRAAPQVKVHTSADIPNGCPGRDAPLLRRRPLHLVHSRRTQPANSRLLQTSFALARPQDQLWPPRTKPESNGPDAPSWLTSAGDEGEEVDAATFRTAPRPSALWDVQGYSPRSDHGEVGIWSATARV